MFLFLFCFLKIDGGGKRPRQNLISIHIFNRVSHTNILLIWNSFLLLYIQLVVKFLFSDDVIISITYIWSITKDL